MEVVAAKTTRRSTRVRVEISLTVTSLDRKHPFAASCVALLVSPQGCGLRAGQALPIGTPVLLSDLPAGNASGRVASCLPLGKDGQNYLIGVSLYNHGNVWGVANPPEDWNCADAAGAASQGRQQWPYNVFSGNVKSHSKK